jgi:hypothetical protein
MEDNSKICSRCGETKVLQNFPSDKTKRGGYSSICKVCLRSRVKSYRTELKKLKEEDPLIKLEHEFEELKIRLTLKTDPKEFTHLTSRMHEILLQISTAPTSTFVVQANLFAEKSSMADVIILSKTPLFLNRELKVIINPHDIKIQWSSDNSSLRIQLPDQIKLNKPQIAALTQAFAN